MPNFINIILINLFLLFIIQTVNGQQFLKGSVVDLNANPINDCYVSNIDRDGKVLQFSITDSSGNFTLKCLAFNDSIILKVSKMGYESQIKIISASVKQQVFQMEEKIFQLKEVKVNTPPIVRNKDTISYNPASYISKADRVVADLLKKIPGVDVLSTGQVLYQGEPINKYYINGLDLLEGRYNLANNNLPIESVKKIQIIENDQPIKILQSNQSNLKASLNIQLKKITKTGYTNIGAGMQPLLWKLNVTPMLFSKSLQMISSVQSNNIGLDLTKETLLLQNSKATDYIASDNSFKYTNIELLNNPNIKTSRWLNNRSNLVSTNILKKINKDIFIKGSISWLIDKRFQYGKLNNRFLTDNINFIEEKSNKLATNQFLGNFILEKNTSTIFIKNSSEILLSKNDFKGFIKRDSSGIDQTQKDNLTKISNDFGLIFKVGGQLFNIKSFFGIRKVPQILKIDFNNFPFSYFNLSKNSIVVQNVNSLAFDNQHSLGFSKNINKLLVTADFGFAYQGYQLKSNLGYVYVPESNQKSLSINDLGFQRKSTFSSFNFQYSNSLLTFNALMPFKFQEFNITDKLYDTTSSIKRMTFEPKLNSKLILSENLSLLINSSFKQNIGDPTQIYTSYILRTYKNLVKRPFLVQYSTSFDKSISINYKNDINYTFVSISLFNNSIKSNLLNQYMFDSTGAVTANYIPLSNKYSKNTLSAYYSRYILQLQTTLKVNYSFTKSRIPTLIDLNHTYLNNSLQNFSFISNSKINNILNLSLNYNYSFLSNSVVNKNKINNSTHQFSFEMIFFPIENQSLSLLSDYFIFNNSSSSKVFYLDLLYRYNLSKKRIDFEISLNNLFNSKEFIDVYNSEIINIRNVYELRPRQILFSIRKSI